MTSSPHSRRKRNACAGFPIISICAPRRVYNKRVVTEGSIWNIDPTEGLSTNCKVSVRSPEGVFVDNSVVVLIFYVKLKKSDYYF